MSSSRSVLTTIGAVSLVGIFHILKQKYQPSSPYIGEVTPVVGTGGGSTQVLLGIHTFHHFLSTLYLL